MKTSEWSDPAYVAAHGTVPHAHAFDAHYFGISANEARAIDPQQRLLLECAHAGLEDAGCDPTGFLGRVGVFSGCGSSQHAARVRADAELMSALGNEIVQLSNSRDFVSTRISYKLGLTGPSIAVLTACSTSLVAIHLACQSLLLRECDLALAGGATVDAEPVGYRFVNGGKLSPDGHCRAFDRSAAGTVPGSGAGIVVLKRLEDALRNGDSIRAVIRGSAINNDGDSKVGFTAPAIRGQAQCITEALSVSEIGPEAIDFIETHGTGTPLGDPIEIAALSEVFSGTNRKEKCAIGSVKTNIGHLDAAAGVAGFIKAVLTLQNQAFPATLHYQSPNPETQLSRTPFYVNTTLKRWDDRVTPLRGGISAFGIGGTNVHVILEEGPAISPPSGRDAPQLIVLSTKTSSSLHASRSNLAAFLQTHETLALRDLAFTLQEGRQAHPERCAAVADSVGATRDLLLHGNGTSWFSNTAKQSISIAFLFPGGGTQYLGMAQDLYERIPFFQETLHRCFSLAVNELGIDLSQIVFPKTDRAKEAQAELASIKYALPALFSIEYAIGQLLIASGIRPKAMLGHSMGEYVAATTAGVFTLDGALRVVSARARLMNSLPKGTMLAVPMSESEAKELCSREIELAAVNSQSNCVLAGSCDAIEALERQLTAREVVTRRLHISHASHSSAMEPILDTFADVVREVPLSAPDLPFLSNVTGTWITADEATDPAYWVNHLRNTVRFSDGLARLRETRPTLLIESGPGQTLTTFAMRDIPHSESTVVTALPSANDAIRSDTQFLSVMGAAWTCGVDIDWSVIRSKGRHSRVSLPTYPFERTEYRVACSRQGASVSEVSGETEMSKANEESSIAGFREDIHTRIRSVFAKLMGIDVAVIGRDRTFLSLGADSLLLMQASRKLESEFGISIPFRLLLTKLSTSDDLGNYLMENLPSRPFRGQSTIENRDPAETSGNTAGPAQAHSSPPVREEAEAGMARSTSALHEIFHRQLAVMQAQLEVLNTGRLGPSLGSLERPSDIDGVRTAPVDRQSMGTGRDFPNQGDRMMSHGPHRPVKLTLNQNAELTHEQRDYFEIFVHGYNTRTRRSKEYAATYRAVLADNRASIGFRLATKELVYPIVGTRSEGVRLWDLDDNEYIDFTLGFGVHFFGHRPGFIVDAVEDQLENGFHLGPQSDLAGPAAKLVCELTDMDRVAFCNTGSEAVMTAIRIARTVTQRNRIVLFRNSYHGCFDGVLARPTFDEGELRSLPVAPGTPQGMVDDVAVLQYGADEALSYIEQNAQNIAAVLVEPIQSRNIEFQPRLFLKQLRATTTKLGIALIFDETITGFRLEQKGAQGFFGIVADLAIYGKLIGGGFPIGIVAGKAFLMDAIDGGSWSFGDDSFPEKSQTFFAGTFCKHPLAMAAVCAVASHLKKEGPNLQAELNARAARLVNRLRSVIATANAPIRITTCCSLFQFHVDGNDIFASLLFAHLVQHGMYIWEGRGCFLSTSHSDEDCDKLVRALADTLSELRSAGFDTKDRAKELYSQESTPSESGMLQLRQYPLTLGQKQIWIHSQISEAASCAYNEQFLCRLEGTLDEAALRQAILDVVQQHEGLRTIFDASGENQYVLSSIPIDLRVHRLSERKTESSPWLKTLRQPFNFTQGPMFRVNVFQQSDSEQILQIVFHHLAIDGVAFSLLYRDLSTAYAARERGERGSLPVAMQLSEYLELIKTRSDSRTEDKISWLRDFDGAVPLAMPTDHPRRGMPTGETDDVRLRLSPDLVTNVSNFGRSNGLTLFMSLLGTLFAALHRFSGQDDIVLGVPYEGRPFPGSESVVAQCIDVLPIRSRVSWSDSLDKLLVRTRDLLLTAYERDTFTYMLLQEQHSSGSRRLPLISVAFNLEPQKTTTGERPRGFGSLSTSKMDNLTGALAKVDIHFDAVEHDAGIDLICQYNRDLYQVTTMDSLLSAWRHTLQQFCVSPECPLDQISVLQEAQRELVLRKWNETGVSYPREECIHDAFERQVQASPDAIAIVFDDTEYTYSEVNQRANQLANYLISIGAGPEVRVGVHLTRGPEQIISILAVLKAGGGYVPLDPSYPVERLKVLVEDSNAPLILSETQVVDTLPLTNTFVVVVDGESSTDIRAQSFDTPRTATVSDNLAYIVYTSGSSGRPKGVEACHRGVTNLAYAQAKQFDIALGRRVLQFASLSFDASVSEIFSTLLTGATLVVARSHEILPGPSLRETLQRGKVNVVTLPPSVLAVQDSTHLPELNTVVSAGESLPSSVVAAWKTNFRKVINAYGPSETTVCASLGECISVAAVPGIGRPIDNMQVYVLDPNLDPVPLGAIGELYIGGAGVARGYLGHPSLTADRFIPDPFGDTNCRIYRTGDLGRWTGNGTLEFVGRSDRQLKLRGFRIEPEEIERALIAQFSVRAAAVVVREDSPGDRRLVAYIVGDSDANRIQDRLSASLPDYMIPNHIVTLEALPLTANGKLDVNSLPLPEFRSAEPTPELPTTPLEATISEIWADILNVARVNAVDDFFALGGHSLLATRLVVRLRDVLGIELSVGTLFENPTVRSLVAWIDAKRSTTIAREPEIVPMSNQPSAPLSSSQERLWFLDKLHPSSSLNNVASGLRLKGQLNVEALVRAFEDIVGRHEILRTQFIDSSEGPRQVAIPHASVPVSVEDLRYLPEHEREALIKRLLRKEASKPFALEKERPVRATLFKLADENHILLVCAHHIVTDEWSTGIFFRELAFLYRQHCLGEPAQLPALRFQYRDYAVWQRQQIVSDDLAWWSRHMSGAPDVSTIPSPHPRPAVLSNRGAFQPIRISQELALQIREFAKRERSTLFITFLTALQTLVAKYSASSDVVIGAPFSGRLRPEWNDLIGLFVNVLPLRTDLSGDPSFREAMSRVRLVTAEASDHQAVPFDHLVKEFRLGRSSNIPPLFQITLTLNEKPKERITLQHLDIVPLEVGIDGVKADISLVVSADGESFDGGFIYNTGLFDGASMSNLSEEFVHLLEQAIKDPDTVLSTLTSKQKTVSPVHTAVDVGMRFVKPDSPLEQVIARVFSTVLARSHIGASDNFFEVGGHSLLAVRAVAHLGEIVGVPISVQTLFDYPTVNELAQWIAEKRELNLPVRRPIERTDQRESIPLSFAQERIWIQQKLQPSSSFYNMPAVKHFHGPLDAASFHRALKDIFNRHDILRTQFVEVDGIPRQVITPGVERILVQHDISHMPVPQREEERQAFIMRTAAAPFDLEQGPLARAVLVKLAEDDHLFILCFHHIICDGWSMTLFFEELLSSYTGNGLGSDSASGSGALQYADYASWQRTQSVDIVAGGLIWWKEQLKDVPPLLPLPTDYPRPPFQGDRSDVVPIALSAQTSAKLQAIAIEEGVTLYMVLLAAWAMVLALYCETEDIVVGTTVAGRTMPELEKIIGLFMNTVVIRTNVSDNPTFQEVITRVKRGALGAFDHQEIPFERLVKEIQPERTLSYTPIFQVLFELHEAMGSSTVSAGLTMSDVAVDIKVAKHDLQISLSTRPSGISGGLTFRTELFDRCSVEGIVSHFTHVITRLAENRQIRLAELSSASEKDLDTLMSVWNDKDDVMEAHRCMHHLFEAQVSKTPDAVALTFGDSTLTYHELDSLANQLAGKLSRFGVQQEARVGIYLERGFDIIVAIFGVLKSGGAYVPVDPGHPSDRVSYILTDSDCKVVLTNASLRDRMTRQDGLTPLLLDELLQEPSPSSQKPLKSDVSASNLAYVIYTSGSTGRPKGVAMHHRGICNYISWGIAAYGADSGNGAPVFSSMSVDLTITNLLPLFAGRPVHVLPEEDPIEHLAALFRTRPDFGLVKITPIHLSLLSNLLDPAEMAACSRTLVIGADFLMGESTVLWQDNAPGTRLLNEYGPTETVVGCSAYEIKQGAHRAGPVPVGRAIQNLKFYVLDSEMTPVAPGIRGELYIGGMGVARGYLNRTALTAEKFVPNPFAQPGSRMYKSGDWARWLWNGSLMIIGRTDNQVKVRGFRVELGEVESVLRRHPAIEECLVVLHGDAASERRLVSYFVGAGTQSELREHLRRSLPDYMVPSAFVKLEALPRTATGKIDPKTLPPPEFKPEHEEGIAPRTSIENTLAGIWADVLGIDNVGVNYNFFALGGDSLLAMQVVSRARKANLRLTPRQLFEYQTIAGLASVVTDYAAVHVTTPVPLSSELLELTPIQLRLFSQVLPKPEHNNQSNLWTVDASITDSDLRRALNIVFSRHDALRLRFKRNDSQWIQWYAANAGIEVRSIDVSALTAGEQDRYQKEIADRKQRSFDLESGPLGAATIFDRGVRGRVLLLILHHLIVDVVSWGILQRELDDACRAILHGEIVTEDEPGSSYLDWSGALRRYATADELHDQREYWVQQNAEGIPKLKTDYPGRNLQSDSAEVRTQLDRDETKAILSAISKMGAVQLHEVLIWALAETIAGLIGHEDVFLDLESHGREEITTDLDLSRTVGWFTSVYPQRLSIPTTAVITDRIASIAHQLRKVPDRGIGYGVLRYICSDEEILSRGRDAEVIFNYLGHIDRRGDSGLIRLARGPHGPERAPENPREYLLELNCAVVSDKLQVSWVFGREVFAEDTVVSIAERYNGHLRSLLGTLGTSDNFPRPRIIADDSSVADLVHISSREDAESEDIQDAYPLAPMQAGMLYHAALEEDVQFYQVSVAYLIKGPLDQALFQHAWQAVISKYEVLRTSIQWEGLPEARQRVHKSVQVPWMKEDWQNLTESEQMLRLDEAIQADRKRGFDLSRPPLMRFGAFQVKEQETWFLWSQHHILLDGWSCSRILGEVTDVYDSWNNGRSVTISAHRPYRDYIQWLMDQNQQAAQDFWMEQVEDYTFPKIVGLGPLRDHDQASRIRSDARLQASATAELHSFARRHSITLNTLCLGLWGFLLSRYTATNDIIVGATFSGRHVDLDGIEEMVGLFINTLPVRIRTTADISVGEWLANLQRTLVQLRNFEYTPLVWIQQWASLSPGSSLFEAHYIFQAPLGRAQEELATEPRLRIEGTRGTEWNHYPLSLLVAPEKELLISLTYSPSRLSQRSARRLVVQFQEILRQVSCNPEMRLGDISLTIDQNDAPPSTLTARPPHGDAPSLHAIFEEQVRRSPDAPAVVFGASTLSYSELNRRANCIARELLGRGVSLGARIAVYLERNLSLPAALLGVLKAGACYVPIDPAQPDERLRFVLEDSMPHMVISQKELLSRVTNMVPADVVLDVDEILAASLDEIDDEVSSAFLSATDDCLSYVIYTSGSTGLPKGVMVRHKEVTRLLWATSSLFDFRTSDTWTMFHSFAFDFSVWEMWGAWSSGARLIIVPTEICRSPDLFREMLSNQQVTILSQTPSAFEMLALLEHVAVSSSLSLRLIVFGGEALRYSALKPWIEHHGDTNPTLFNMYGITETTVHTTVRRISAEDVSTELESPIGTALANSRICLLDEFLEPVKDGTIGELCVGGEGVTLGYMGRPDLTAERFCPDPFDGCGGRLYRSGDLARVRADGELTYCGRADRQIKINGYRIEMGEIEARIRDYPGVVATVVTTKTELSGMKALCAYYVSSARIPPHDFRAYLTSCLPQHMVPAAFVLVREFPLTSNGKLNYDELPSPEPHDYSVAVYREPTGSTEVRLASIWEEVLATQRVGRLDNFFALGGHSLHVMRIVAMIHTAFGVRLNIKAIFAHPLLSSMAAEIDHALHPSGYEQGEQLAAKVITIP
ncbi:MAG: putative linear pentadecapeptide gramicidin synthetase LgrB [Acidobacteriaceae bacterium]|nr:putative linear pentadecapeptide gramicidin synthetase LgrB [Acidobacteriaceae bacterium]